jgi:hypothetical protein
LCDVEKYRANAAEKMFQPFLPHYSEGRSYNRGAQIQICACQLINYVDRELGTLYRSESEPGSSSSSGELNFTFVPAIIGPGKVPSARVALAPLD